MNIILRLQILFSFMSSSLSPVHLISECCIHDYQFYYKRTNAYLSFQFMEIFSLAQFLYVTFIIIRSILYQRLKKYPFVGIYPIYHYKMHLKSINNNSIELFKLQDTFASVIIKVLWTSMKFVNYQLCYIWINTFFARKHIVYHL